MDREQKLKELEFKKTPNKIALITGDDFSNVLDEKIKGIRETLNAGIELNNIDDLLEKLDILQNFHQEVKELKVIAEGIKAIQIPDRVSLDGLNDLIKVIEDRPIPKIVNKINNTNIIDEYQATNSDSLDDANKYYGFTHSTGKWYVLWISGSQQTKAYKYATGESAYPQNWGQRKRLGYKRFDQVSL